ncbi:hypothetical protein BGX38DRAFT_1273866 [Terfezia claveryi]|nr:hypothetical protein BGX38DRAFT_1273866 [Terfezia claveryi]
MALEQGDQGGKAEMGGKGKRQERQRARDMRYTEAVATCIKGGSYTTELFVRDKDIHKGGAQALGEARSCIGELPNLEPKDEIPPFALILIGPPGDGKGKGFYKSEGESNLEEILEDNIKMGPHLSGKQREELFGLVMDFLDVFSKGACLGKVKGFKAAICTEGPLPTPQQARPTGPMKRKIIDKMINQLLA